MKILIAEDDPIMLATIEHFLTMENFSFVSAKDGTEALAALQSFKPDLLITDILMPLTSGLELIGIVRSDPANKIPILVLSSVDQEETVYEALSLGANDYVTKPFTPEELNGRIKRLLKKKKKAA